MQYSDQAFAPRPISPPEGGGPSERAIDDNDNPDASMKIGISVIVALTDNFYRIFIMLTPKLVSIRQLGQPALG